MLDLYQRSPVSFFATLVVLLIVTLIAYGAIPTILASARKKPITKARYRTYCYCLNFLVLFLFIVINDGAVNGWPYILWTSVFANSGSKTLRKKGLLQEPPENEESKETGW